MRQAERALQREVMYRLNNPQLPLDAIVIPSPNGLYIPARTPAERTLAARIVHQLKADGGLTPGAPDLTFLWAAGSGLIELKRPAEKRLVGRQDRGRLSPEQLAFSAKCKLFGVPYVVCQSWAEVRDTLISWGRLPPGYVDPENRIGRAA